MPLTCGATWESDEPGAIFYTDVSDFMPLTTSKRKRCASCIALIDLQSLVVRFSMYRTTRDEIEEKIYGDGGWIPIAPKYLCEKCGEIYYNLHALGFEDIWIGEDMRKLLKEYQNIYNPQKIGAL